MWNLFKVYSSDTRVMSVFLKVTLMQTEKPLINDRLCVSKISWRFHIPTIFNFAVIYPWNLLFFKKAAYFLTVYIVFSFISKTLRLNNLKLEELWTWQFQCLLFVLKRLYIGYYIISMTVLLMSSCQWSRSSVFFCLLWTDYTICSRLFIVDFEQINTHWVCSDFCVWIHLFCSHFYIVTKISSSYWVFLHHSCLNKPAAKVCKPL